jgi:hypothetical protein
VQPLTLIFLLEFIIPTKQLQQKPEKKQISDLFEAVT